MITIAFPADIRGVAFLGADSAFAVYCCGCVVLAEVLRYDHHIQSIVINRLKNSESLCSSCITRLPWTYIRRYFLSWVKRSSARCMVNFFVLKFSDGVWRTCFLKMPKCCSLSNSTLRIVWHPVIIGVFGRWRDKMEYLLCLYLTVQDLTVQATRETTWNLRNQRRWICVACYFENVKN